MWMWSTSEWITKGPSCGTRYRIGGPDHRTQGEHLKIVDDIIHGRRHLEESHSLNSGAILIRQFALPCLQITEFGNRVSMRLGAELDDAEVDTDPPSFISTIDTLNVPVTPKATLCFST